MNSNPEHIIGDVEEYVQYFNTLSLRECSPDIQILDQEKTHVEDDEIEQGTMEANATNVQSNFKAEDDAVAPSKEVVVSATAKTLTTNLTYITNILDKFKDHKERLPSLTFEFEYMKESNQMEGRNEATLRTEIEEEIKCIFGFYDIHSDRKCLYYEMMKIAAQKVVGYLKQYVTIPWSKNTEPNNEELELHKVPENNRFCLLHMDSMERYLYVMAMQSTYTYIYITRLKKAYKEAMKDVKSCKFIAILFSINHNDKSQKLTMITITTPRATYVIDMLALRLWYLPGEIRRILQSPKIAKFVIDAHHFETYFENKYHVKCLSVCDVTDANLELRRKFDPNYCPLEPFQFLEEAAENFDNLKIKIGNDLSLRWLHRPPCTELIDTSAKTSFYLFKVACCIKLTYMFLSRPLSEHIATEQHTIAI